MRRVHLGVQKLQPAQNIAVSSSCCWLVSAAWIYRSSGHDGPAGLSTAEGNGIREEVVIVRYFAWLRRTRLHTGLPRQSKRRSVALLMKHIILGPAHDDQSGSPVPAVETAKQ